MLGSFGIFAIFSDVYSSHIIYVDSDWVIGKFVLSKLCFAFKHSVKNDFIHIISVITSYKDMYSAWVVDDATHVCFLLGQEIAAPASLTAYPLTDLASE